MPPSLQVLDYVLAAAGVAVLVTYTGTLGIRGWAASTAAPHRRIRPEMVALPIVAYLIINVVSIELWDVRVAATDSGAAPTPTSPEVSMLANVLSLGVGGVACLVVARAHYPATSAILIGPTRLLLAVLWAVGGLLAALPLCALTDWLSRFVIQFLDPGFAPREHEILELLQRGDLPAWYTTVMWASVLAVAPLAEELFFRGLLHSALRQVLDPLPVITGVAVLFGVAHAGQLQAVVPLAVFGGVLGYVRERTQGLLAPILLHMLFNLKTMIFFSLMS